MQNMKNIEEDGLFWMKIQDVQNVKKQSEHYCLKYIQMVLLLIVLVAIKIKIRMYVLLLFRILKNLLMYNLFKKIY